MKPGVIFVLFALGTFICITCAAPASSEIQQDDDLDSEMTDKELVEIVKQIVNQEKLGDKELAQAELFKSLGLGLLKNVNWGNVLGRLGGLAKGFLRNARKPRRQSPYYPAQQPYNNYRSYGYGRRGHYESAKNQGEKEIIKTQRIDAELQAQTRLNEALKDLIATKEQDEEIDDYDDEAQGQSETIEELEGLLAAKEQDKEDRDALTAAMKADDSADLVESQDDGEDDDDDDDQDEDDDNNKEDIEAELQRKRKRQRHKSRNRHGYRRGYRNRGSHIGGRRGGHSGRNRNRGRNRGHTTRGRRPSWLRRFPWNDILSGVGTFAGGLLGNLFNPSPSPSPSPGFWEKNKLEVQQINDDDDYDDTDNNDVAHSETLKLNNELENLPVATQQDVEFDDNDAKFQAQSEVLKELMKILIAANQE